MRLFHVVESYRAARSHVHSACDGFGMRLAKPEVQSWSALATRFRASAQCGVL